MLTTTKIEILILIMTGATTLLSSWLWWHSTLDLQLLRRLHSNGIKRVTIRARLLQDFMRTLCAMSLFVSGVVVLHTEPHHDDFYTIALMLTLLLVATMLGVAVVGDMHWRVAINDVLTQYEAQQREYE